MHSVSSHPLKCHRWIRSVQCNCDCYCLLLLTLYLFLLPSQSTSGYKIVEEKTKKQNKNNIRDLCRPQTPIDTYTCC